LIITRSFPFYPWVSYLYRRKQCLFCDTEVIEFLYREPKVRAKDLGNN